MLKWVLMLAVALGAAQQAAAQTVEYHLIANDANSAGVLDKLSIKPAGGYRRGWLTVIFVEPPKVSGDAVAFLSSYHEVDCAQDRIRTLALVARDVDYKMVTDTQTPTEWKYVEPNTHNGEIRTALCRPDTLTADNFIPQTDLREVRGYLLELWAKKAAEQK